MNKNQDPFEKTQRDVGTIPTELATAQSLGPNRYQMGYAMTCPRQIMQTKYQQGREKDAQRKEKAKDEEQQSTNCIS